MASRAGRGGDMPWMSGNWRITFGWLDGDAVDVDMEDYH
jgi:plasmid maintenance system killer protein